MRLRIVCALVLASQLVLVAMLLGLTGWSAIVYSFAGTPLLGAAVFLVALSWWRNKEGSREEMDRNDPSGRSARHSG